MNALNNLLAVEKIHFIIAVALSLLVEVISKSKYKSLADDMYIERIRRDKNSFIDYIAMIILCIGLSVIFSENISSIFDWTLNMLTGLSMWQHLSFSKFGKDTGNEHYNKIIEIVDFLVIGCWGAITLTTLMSINEFWVISGVMAFFAVASLWGLKELKKIESDYLSTMQ